MIDLVNIYQAKLQLHIADDNHDYDEDLEMKVTQASRIALTYMKRRNADEWQVDTSPATSDVPHDIQSATLMILAEIHYNRESGATNPLSEAVKMLLRPYRLPTMA